MRHATGHLFFGSLLALASCVPASSDTRTTDTHSRELPDDDAKIQFLQKYITPASEIQAAEFHLWYRDNSGTPPGPSDWDMRVVVKVSKETLPLWTVGGKRAESADLEWGYGLLPNEPRWEVRSRPVIYSRGKTIVAIFEPEGIVFERRTTLP